MPKETKPKVRPRPTHTPTTHRPQRKAAERTEAKAAKGTKSKAKGGPKRALSAYMFFSQDWRERIKSENPDAGFGMPYHPRLSPA